MAEPNETKDEVKETDQEPNQEPENEKKPAKKNAPKKNAPKKVKIRLPRDDKKGDLFVAVNGESILIKRGEEVEIDEKYYEAIQNSELAEEYALEKREEMKTV